MGNMDVCSGYLYGDNDMQNDLISTQEAVVKIVDTAIRKILSGEQKLTKEYEQSVKDAVNVILDTARCEISQCKSGRRHEMRAIDADVLIHELNNSHYPGAPYVDAGISIAIGKVCDAPTIVPPHKTGHWIDEKIQRLDGTFYWFRECSECGYARIDCNPDMDTNFCPNCGAQMESKK